MIAYPVEMIPHLRSDHAGETGAVSIYKTLIRISGDTEVSAFARKHLSSEIYHLQKLGEIIPGQKQSRLLFLWSTGGACIARFSSLFGRCWIYGVVGAVEDGVVKHYRKQLDMLEGRDEYAPLYDFLKKCQDDEVLHRDEASAMCGPPGFLLKLWCGMIKAGSAITLGLTRKF